MNVLIAVLSTLRNEKKEYEYEIKVNDRTVEKIKAYHTNESILRCVASLKSVKETGGLGKIIVLVSKRAYTEKSQAYGNLTAIDYYKGIAEQNGCCRNIITKTLENGNGTLKDMGFLVDQIATEINEEDNIYIDAAGGQRDMTSLIQVLVKILKYKGIKEPVSLYSNIQNEQGFIESQEYFNRMLNLTDAINEFMTEGRVDQLNRLYKGINVDGNYHELLDCLNEFSDKISLCDVGKIDETVKKLGAAYQKCSEKGSDSTMESVILKQFLPLIKKNFLDEQEKGVNYIKLLDWCLQNSLIQQALTIFTEKIAVCLFDEKVIYFKSNRLEYIKNHEKDKNPLLPSDWQTKAFYADILESNSEDKEVEELKKRIKLADKKSKLQSVSLACKAVDEGWKKRSNYTNKDPKVNQLLQIIRNGKFANEEKYRNALVNNINLLRILLDKPEEKETNSLTKKFMGIQKIKDGLFKSADFAFNVPEDIIVQVYYGYLYVKSVRNLTNHASSSENLEEEQKKTLAENGYDFSAFNVSTVSRNLSIAIDSVKNAVLTVQKQTVNG